MRHPEERACPGPCVSLSGGSCEKPDSQGLSPLSRPALWTGSCEPFRAVHAKSPPSGRGVSPHAVEKQAFFQEGSLGTRPVPGPVRCPTSRRFRTPKRPGGWSRPGRRSRPAARGAAALTTAAAPAYFTKRPVVGSCYFGKMAGSGRCSRLKCLHHRCRCWLNQAKSRFPSLFVLPQVPLCRVDQAKTISLIGRRDRSVLGPSALSMQLDANGPLDAHIRGTNPSATCITRDHRTPVVLVAGRAFH
jgi:hypothetical protein